jgi:hypothetical protein
VRDVHALSNEEWFWCGGVSFSVRFSSLYVLTVYKGESVFDMRELGWGEEGGAWR